MAIKVELVFDWEDAETLLKEIKEQFKYKPYCKSITWHRVEWVE